MTEQINAFQMAQRQFDGVAKQLNLDPQVSEVLRWPAREFQIHHPREHGRWLATCVHRLSRPTQ